MISSELYGLYEVRPQDYDDMSVTALELNGTGAAKTLTLTFPAAPLYFGFRPVEAAFEYDTATQVGVLGLYKYPGGDSSKAVLLASIDLEDQALRNAQYMVKVPVIPDTGTSQGHAKKPLANCIPEDQLVVKFITQATGGGYLEGDFQPVLIMQHRPESFAEMPSWNDRTVASSGISSAQ